MQLEVDSLSKIFEHHIALQEISFCIPNCKIIGFLGPSGSGKSTLLRVIAGLEEPTSGYIFINKKEIQFTEQALLTHRRGVGVVFQALNLFPHLTVLENIKLPLYRVHGFSQSDAKKRAIDLLSRFNLEEQAYKKPSQLSGGQRQRVAIVRAVAIKPKLFLLDEPTSALDPLMTSEVLDLISELRNQGTDIILVSHHVGFVKNIADWIVFLDKGKILEYSTAAEFFSKPKTVPAQQFLEKVLKH